MITISRRLAKQVRSVFRQALGLTGRRNLPTVQLLAGPDGLHIRCGNGPAAAEYHLEGEQPDATIYVPFELHSEIEGNRDTPVTIAEHDKKVTAR